METISAKIEQIETGRYENTFDAMRMYKGPTLTLAVIRDKFSPEKLQLLHGMDLLEKYRNEGPDDFVVNLFESEEEWDNACRDWALMQPLKRKSIVPRIRTSKFIRKLIDQKEILRGEDGYYIFWPNAGKALTNGAYNSGNLREIATWLDQMNKEKDDVTNS